MLHDLASGDALDLTVYDYVVRRSSFEPLGQEIHAGGRQAALRALPILEEAGRIYNARALAAMAAFLEGLAALEPGSLLVAAPAVSAPPVQAAEAALRPDRPVSGAAQHDFDAAVRLARRLGLLADGAQPSIHTSGPSLLGYHLRDGRSRTLARINRQMLRSAI